jgi:large subunit ribosomal protein L18
MNTQQVRVRRARKTRAKIAAVKAVRLSVHRTNCHIYAQIISEDGARVLASASTVEKEVRAQVPNGGDAAAAAVVGKRLAEKARSLGIEKVAFDRSGFRFHGRVKALADAARENGLVF